MQDLFINELISEILIFCFIIILNFESSEGFDTRVLKSLLRIHCCFFFFFSGVGGWGWVVGGEREQDSSRSSYF